MKIFDSFCSWLNKGGLDNEGLFDQLENDEEYQKSLAEQPNIDNIRIEINGIRYQLIEEGSRRHW